MNLGIARDPRSSQVTHDVTASLSVSILGLVSGIDMSLHGVRSLREASFSARQCSYVCLNCECEYQNGGDRRPLRGIQSQRRRAGCFEAEVVYRCRTSPSLNTPKTLLPSLICDSTGRRTRCLLSARSNPHPLPFRNQRCRSRNSETHPTPHQRSAAKNAAFLRFAEEFAGASRFVQGVERGGD